MQQAATPPSAPPPVTPQPTGAGNPYSFLFEESKKSKKSLIPSGNSIKQRILIVLVGVLVLLTVVMLVLSVLNRSSATAKADLERAARQQAEIIRIATIGASKAKDAKTKNLALTTSLSLSSAQAGLLKAVQQNGGKLTTKQLAGAKNATTDALLTNAEKSNTFDSVFSQELKTELTTYKDSLKKAYDSSNSEKIKNTLSAYYDQANVLLNSSSN